MSDEAGATERNVPKGLRVAVAASNGFDGLSGMENSGTPVIDDILRTLSDFGTQTAQQFATVQQALVEASPVQIDLHDGINLTVNLPGTNTNARRIESTASSSLQSAQRSPTDMRSRTGSSSSIPSGVRTVSETQSYSSQMQQPRKSDAANETNLETGISQTANLPEAFQPMSYYSDWQRLFSEKLNKKLLYDVAVRSETARCGRFRSVFWRVFLEVLPAERSGWSERLAEQRGVYEAMRAELVVSESSLESANTDDPLSQRSESRWFRFFADREMRSQIAQDVRRCMPEVAFFQDESVQDRVLTVLFLYCRKSGKPYRQGMHELLAPLVFAVNFDTVMYTQARESAHQRHAAGLCGSANSSSASCESCALLSDGLLAELFDSRFEEHDCYALFATLMDAVEPWYAVSVSQSVRVASLPPSNVIKLPEPFESEYSRRRLDLVTGPPGSNALGTKLARIHDVLLKRCDAELQAHLDAQGIAVQLYGIRWIRLLFGREFALSDLLVVWDTLFAETCRLGGLDFVDWLFCAMLMYVRSALLSSDVSECLQSLMRYPRVNDVRDVIALAFHLREPQRFRRPLLLNETYNRFTIPPSPGMSSNASSNQLSSTINANRDSSSNKGSGGSNADWAGALKRGFTKKMTTSSNRKASEAEQVSNDTAPYDCNNMQKRGVQKTNIRNAERELQPIDRSRSSASNADWLATAPTKECEDKLLVRRETLETIFFIIETYADQVDSAVKKLHDAVVASDNLVQNPEQIDSAFDELRRVQIVLKATVAECRTHMNDVADSDRVAQHDAQTAAVGDKSPNLHHLV